MKKFMVLAMTATLLMAGSAFAVERHLTPAPNATFAFGAPGVAFGPTTTNNDDSCDIGNAPAATLLLPHFDVDPTSGGSTTLFTITNVTRLPQIAHVTVWTDLSFPVLDFNLFLTGYDVAPINLFDVIVRGSINQSASPTTPGPLSASNTTGNANLAAVTNCTNLPGNLPPGLAPAVLSALTLGTYNPGGGVAACSNVGLVHAHAIGYVTIDVASNCSTRLPNDPLYYQNDILFDNVLIGDYQQLAPSPAGTGAAAGAFDAGGSTLVAIRAVPEGGPAGTPLAGAQTNLPYTFYDRYTPATNRTLDRRQPLPSTFAARYIGNGAATGFATNYKIWREGFGTGTCSTVAQNATLPISEIVKFDEAENPFTFGTGVNCSPCGTTTVSAPETSSRDVAGANFPTLASSTQVAGWTYLNLNNGGSSAYSVTRNVGGVPTIITGVGSTSNLAPIGGSTTIGPRPSQNWVIVSMFGNVGANRLSVDFDAQWLGNGCSPAAAAPTTAGGGAVAIAPAGGVLVCPAGDPGCTPGVAPYTGTNTTPLP
jgi:hypothetical protein